MDLTKMSHISSCRFFGSWRRMHHSFLCPICRETCTVSWFICLPHSAFVHVYIIFAEEYQWFSLFITNKTYRQIMKFETTWKIPLNPFPCHILLGDEGRYMQDSNKSLSKFLNVKTNSLFTKSNGTKIKATFQMKITMNLKTNPPI